MSLPWGAEPGESSDRGYYDPDPYRHLEAGDPHRCEHPTDDHTYVDGGCSWLGCPCRWFDAESVPPDDEDEYAHVALADLVVEPEPVFDESIEVS